MRYFLKVDSNKIITDVIDYPFSGYIEVNVADSLPAGVNGGWYKYEGGQIVEHPELKPPSGNEEIEGLKKSIIRLEEMNTLANNDFIALTDALIEMGVI